MVWEVLLLGSLTALATGLGAVPFYFLRAVTRRTVAHAGAVASGLMLGAGFGLILEGSGHGVLPTLVGAAAGVGFILAGERLLASRPELVFGPVRGRGAKQVVLVLAIMTVHSFAEGVAVGVSFGGGMRLALLITLAIAVHNVPEGLAITAVMRPRGTGLVACAAWSVLSSLPQPLMAVPAFLFVETFRQILPYGLGFASGAMSFMVFLELLPEAYGAARKSVVGLLVSLTLGLMVLLQQLLGA